jgi:hypothetical protein
MRNIGFAFWRRVRNGGERRYKTYGPVGGAAACRARSQQLRDLHQGPQAGAESLHGKRMLREVAVPQIADSEFCHPGERRPAQLLCQVVPAFIRCDEKIWRWSATEPTNVSSEDPR